MPRAGYTSLIKEDTSSIYSYNKQFQHIEYAVEDYTAIVTPEFELFIAETLPEGSPYVVYTPYGFKLGGIFKGIGRAIHGLVKGAGRVIHYGVKFLGQAAPLLVPVVVGAGISAIAARLGATAFATASASSVAKAVAAGQIGAALTQGAALAAKVAITNVASGLILKSIYKAPKGQPAVVAVGNKPAIVIPAFVRELVEPNSLVKFVTKNNTIKNSKVIQQRIDWLAKKITDTAQQLAKISKECSIVISQQEALKLLKRLFYKIPPTKPQLEAKLKKELALIRKEKCGIVSRQELLHMIQSAPKGKPAILKLGEHTLMVEPEIKDVINLKDLVDFLIAKGNKYDNIMTQLFALRDVVSSTATYISNRLQECGMPATKEKVLYYLKLIFHRIPKDVKKLKETTLNKLKALQICPPQKPAYSPQPTIAQHRQGGQIKQIAMHKSATPQMQAGMFGIPTKYLLIGGGILLLTLLLRKRSEPRIIVLPQTRVGEEVK